jgi:hypothetical protein
LELQEKILEFYKNSRNKDYQREVTPWKPMTAILP